MKVLGNILWLVVIGWLLALLWAFFGLLWCVSIVGIPVGLQCFKFAQLSLLPFGREIVFSDSGFSLIINVLWLIFGGVEICACAVVAGLILCVTIIGIPFGLQCFKLAKLALLPFGAHVRWAGEN